MTRDSRTVSRKSDEILERALMIVQEQIANRKAEIANCDLEIARLKALEISLKNSVRIMESQN